MPKRTDLRSILIIGSGPIVIGQACEFDYSGTQACKALKEEGYRIILVNSNPATIMTDPEFADRTYIEPLTPETLERIIEKEKPDALLPTMGGQTALNCALDLYREGILKKYNVEMIGASRDAIDMAGGFEEGGDVIGVMGKVAVHFEDEFVVAFEGPEEARTVRAAQAGFARTMKHLETRFLAGQFVRNLVGPIGGVIVHHEYVDGNGQRKHPLNNPREVVPLVERRNDDRQFERSRPAGGGRRRTYVGGPARPPGRGGRGCGAAGLDVFLGLACERREVGHLGRHLPVGATGEQRPLVGHLLLPVGHGGRGRAGRGRSPDPIPPRRDKIARSTDAAKS